MELVVTIGRAIRAKTSTHALRVRQMAVTALAVLVMRLVSVVSSPLLSSPLLSSPENTCDAYTFGNGEVGDDSGGDACTDGIVLSAATDTGCGLKVRSTTWLVSVMVITKRVRNGWLSVIDRLVAVLPYAIYHVL